MTLTDEVERLREALGFASSVIKSGEPWTATCERVIGGALRPAPASPEPRPVRLGPSFDPAEVADYHYGMGQESAMRDAVAWLYQHPGCRAAALDLAREFKVTPPAAPPDAKGRKKP